jgi:redox-sensitive bicupin YhaK (pirin superfamily)
MKKVLEFVRGADRHWVGDGFPVRTVLSPRGRPDRVSPFLMLDYAGPATFPPADKPRGVEEHPHKGFETVTIVYAGEVEHRDSAGGGGRIGPGDVQWMTAASGLVHEEMHGREFTNRGGTFEVIQLWVNLPAKDKSGKPHYQAIATGQIPTVALPDSAGAIRVIAGTFGGTTGPARTYTPVNVWDVKLTAGKSAELPVPAGYNTLVFVRKGEVKVENGETLRDAELAVYDRAGAAVSITATKETELVVLAGEPIGEPVVSYGPFVMNTQAEIQQAVEDYRRGRMGKLAF